MGGKPAVGVMRWMMLPSLRIGYCDARRTQDLLAGAVAGLEHLHHGGRVGRLHGAVLGPRGVHQGLVQVRVELLADRAVALEAELAERRLELVGDGRER